MKKGFFCQKKYAKSHCKFFADFAFFGPFQMRATEKLASGRRKRKVHNDSRALGHGHPSAVIF